MCEADTKERLRWSIANACCEIERLFKPGARVTVLVRNPAFPESSVIVTSDTTPEILAEIAKLAAPPASEGEEEGNE